MKNFQGVLEYKQLLTRTIIHLRVRLVEPREIDFIAGQYIRLDSRPYTDKPAVTRTFSLASSPSQKNIVDFIIRRNPAGICTPWIFDVLQVGETITFSGPLGRFRLSDSRTPALFIAGGSGMSALLAILQDMIDRRIERRIRFFFGAQTQSDLYFTDLLGDMEKKYPWFSFIPALSQEPENSSWTGERGLITETVKKRVSDAPECEGYLCGPPPMIQECIKVLTSMGMPEDKIFFDAFIPQEFRK